jgi:hypothetical protein
VTQPIIGKHKDVRHALRPAQGIEYLRGGWAIGAPTLKEVLTATSAPVRLPGAFR